MLSNLSMLVVVACEVKNGCVWRARCERLYSSLEYYTSHPKWVFHSDRVICERGWNGPFGRFRKLKWPVKEKNGNKVSWYWVVFGAQLEGVRSEVFQSWKVSVRLKKREFWGMVRVELKGWMSGEWSILAGIGGRLATSGANDSGTDLTSESGASIVLCEIWINLRSLLSLLTDKLSWYPTLHSTCRCFVETMTSASWVMSREHWPRPQQTMTSDRRHANKENVIPSTSTSFLPFPPSLPTQCPVPKTQSLSADPWEVS